MLAPSNLIEISYHFWISFDVQFFPIGKRSDDIFGRFAFNAIINDDLRTFLFMLWLHFGIIKANITVMDSAFDEPHCKLLISGALFSYGILLKNNSHQQKCWIEILFLLLNFHAWPPKSHFNDNPSLEYTKYETCTQTLTHPKFGFRIRC